MNKTYAGIGSRETPDNILKLMFKCATYLHNIGYTLRSGGADGADTSFEDGADFRSRLIIIHPQTGERIWEDGRPYKEIYLPWSYFNRKVVNNTTIINASKLEKFEEAKKLACTIHPMPSALTKGALSLHGRNCFQILGKDLDDPVDFVICYTDPTYTRGGTRTAVKLAQQHKVPIWNLAIPEDLETVSIIINMNDPTGVDTLRNKV